MRWVVALVLACAACGGADQCVAGERRCSGTDMQVCAPDGTWSSDHCVGTPESGVLSCQEGADGPRCVRVGA